MGPRTVRHKNSAREKRKKLKWTAPNKLYGLRTLPEQSRNVMTSQGCCDIDLGGWGYLGVGWCLAKWQRGSTSTLFSLVPRNAQTCCSSPCCFLIISRSLIHTHTNTNLSLASHSGECNFFYHLSLSLSLSLSLYFLWLFIHLFIYFFFLDSKLFKCFRISSYT